MATYIDGVKVQEKSDAYGLIMSVFANATNNYLGASYYEIDPDFAGYMDNVAIYNQALSADDMAKLVDKQAQDDDQQPDIDDEDAEILTGTAWWSSNQRGRDYTLNGNGTVELDVEVQELIDDGAFTVELVARDTRNQYYLTTNSNKEVWTAGAADGQGTLSGDNVPINTGKSSLTEGHTYRITVWRSNKDFVVRYYDTTAGKLYAEFKWSGGNMPNSVNVNIIAQTGTYKVKLQGIRNEVPADSEPGDKTETPDNSTNNNVTPGRATISSIKNNKKNTVVFKIKKVKNAVGYQYSYSTDKTFKKSTKKTTKKLSVTLKKLKKKKTYYVRVRAYSVTGKTKKYGKWSKTKSIKIKK